MASNYFVDKRRSDKQKLLDFIKSHPELTFKKLAAVYSMNTGLRMSTVEVYIDELRCAELIE